MILIVGLGNPGNKYKNTRHNSGFKVVDNISSRYCMEVLPDKKMCAYLGRGEIEGRTVLLAKPQSFMNDSGIVVSSLVRYFRISAQSGLVVVCDDIDLPPGCVRIRKKGSSGGHKGLESIIKELGNSNFIRVRIGVGRPLKKRNVIGYVLSEFNKNELEVIKNSIARAGEAIKTVISEGVEKAMSIYNREE